MGEHEREYGMGESVRVGVGKEREYDDGGEKVGGGRESGRGRVSLYKIGEKESS